MTRAPAAAVASPPPSLEASYEYCAAIARDKARNFYYGMKLTPEPKRSAMYAVYAWMRAVDDLADEPGDPADRTTALHRFRDWTDAALAGDPPPDDVSPRRLIWPAVMDVLHRYDVGRCDLHAMIDGQLADQQPRPFARFDDLRTYCYQVASTVGLICITIWGHDGSEAARQAAVDRGIAFQLTNILRDVVEDAERGRVYLPACDLAEAGYVDAARQPDVEGFAQAVRLRSADSRFDALVKKLAARAREFYTASESLEPRISADCRATSWAMLRIYRGLLDRIAARPHRVLEGRVRLSHWRKMAIGASAAWRRGWRP